MKYQFEVSAFSSNGGRLANKVSVRSSSVQSVCRALLGTKVVFDFDGFKMENRIARLEFHSQKQLTKGKIKG